MFGSCLNYTVNLQNKKNFSLLNFPNWHDTDQRKNYSQRTLVIFFTIEQPVSPLLDFN